MVDFTGIPTEEQKQEMRKQNRALRTNDSKAPTIESFLSNKREPKDFAGQNEWTLQDILDMGKDSGGGRE